MTYDTHPGLDGGLIILNRNVTYTEGYPHEKNYTIFLILPGLRAGICSNTCANGFTAGADIH